jgi:REP element-mobilizing transposase RayT
MRVTTNNPAQLPSPETSLAEFDTLNVSSQTGWMVEDDQHRSIDIQIQPRQIFEPVSDHPYNLSYACLLIPRFISHHLVGDVVEYIYEWMQQICISYGWQLEYIDVQPEHMQWIINVPAAISPAHFIRLTRELTSNRIFAHFPRYKKQNLGKDFWAPGHLVIVGKQPHSPEMIQEFIRLTRQQQGFHSFSRFD